MKRTLLPLFLALWCPLVSGCAEKCWHAPTHPDDPPGTMRFYPTKIVPIRFDAKDAKEEPKRRQSMDEMPRAQRFRGQSGRLIECQGCKVPTDFGRWVSFTQWKRDADGQWVPGRCGMTCPRCSEKQYEPPRCADCGYLVCDEEEWRNGEFVKTLRPFDGDEGEQRICARRHGKSCKPEVIE